MPIISVRLAIGLVLCATLLQYLKTPVLLGLGLGVMIQPISDFPYQCRRIYSPRLEACEDMWLSESTRQLFLACSEPEARDKWAPNMGFHVVKDRSRNDAVFAMDIDTPQGDSFAYRALATPGFGYELHLLGISGEDQSDGSVRLHLVNMKPSVDEDGNLVDQTAVGSNNTVEVFTTGPAASKMTHIRTYRNSQIATPNRPASLPGDQGVYISNDHGQHQLGLRHFLSLWIGTADVTYCNATTCKRVVSGQRFPNGLILGRDGLLYVPSSGNGGIAVYSIQADNSLEYVDQIAVPYSIDNISQDGNGDIFAAAFPRALQTLLGIDAQSTVIRIKKSTGGTYSWEKVLEDRDREVLAFQTTAVHDAKTGRLFLSGVNRRFIVACDPK